MILQQPTLNNFAQFKSLGLFGGTVNLSESGIIHSPRQICDNCGCLCNYNGSSNKGIHAMSRSIESFFQKGQQICPECRTTIQVYNDFRDQLIQKVNEFIKTQIISLSEHMSEEDIIEHLQDTMSITVPKSSVHSIITKVNQDLDDYEFEYEVHDGFYLYDEQYIKIDGRQAYRIVIFDPKINQPIYQEVHYKFSKKILKEILRKVFGDSKPKGFAVDMRVEYPSAFEAVFGKKIKVQFCVFHLNKLILKEYRDCLKLEKKVNWTLIQKYYLYELFNIFYDRGFELNILKSMFENWSDFKQKINKEIINKFKKRYRLKVKDEQILKNKIIEIEQRRLLKKFRIILHEKRNERKKNKQTHQVRSVESAVEVFDLVNKTRSKFPEKIRQRIIKIEKNFKYFTASKGEIMTTNKLEGFFGATLRKFKKKSSRCVLSISSLLKRKRAKAEGIRFFAKFTIFDIATIFTAVAFFT